MKVYETKRCNRKVFAREFDSIHELVKYNNDTPHNREIFKHIQSSVTGGKRFTMTSSYEEASNLLQYGWDPGAKQLNKELKIANAQQTDKIVQRSVYDVVGFQASVPRYLQGIPTNMVNKRIERRKQKSVTLIKSIAYSAKVKADEILKDSVKFLQIIQAIEKQGIRVNAYVVQHIIKRKEECMFRVKIKSANERLNVSKMSFPLIHPSFLRRIMFKTLEVESRLTEIGWPIGYGKPAKWETKELLGKNEYFIPALISEGEINQILNNVSEEKR